MAKSKFVDRAVRAYKDGARRRYGRLLWMIDRIDTGDFLMLPHVPEWGHLLFVRVVRQSGDKPSYRWVGGDEFHMNHRLAVELPKTPKFAVLPYGHEALSETRYRTAAARYPIWHAATLDLEPYTSATTSPLLMQHLDHAFELGLGYPCPTEPESGVSAWRGFKARLFARLERSVRTEVRELLKQENISAGEFERLLRDLFQDMGYSIIASHQYDRAGGDFDLVLERPGDLLSQSETIAVQAKRWRDVIDLTEPVQQLQQRCQTWNAQYPKRTIDRMFVVTTAEKAQNSKLVEEDDKIDLVLRKELVELLIRRLEQG